MNNFIEVSCYEEASHLQIIHNRFPDLGLTEDKVYELKLGKVDAFDIDDYYVVDDKGRNNAGIIAVKTRKLLSV